MAGHRHRPESATDLDVVVTGGADAEASVRPRPMLPWWAAATAGGALAAAVMWVLVCGTFALGWVAAPELEPSTVFSNGTRAWLLAYFAGASLAGLTITVPPLGLTLLALVIGTGLASFATSQARLAEPEELTGRERRRIALRVVAAFTAAHTLAVMVPSFFVASPEQSARALIGAAGVGALASGIGAIRTAQWRATEEWPAWARALPSAVAVGLLVVHTAGAVVLVIALVHGHARVEQLHTSLQPDALGGVLLVTLQLLWLPNLVIWCTSWALGAGLQVGTGTVLTPTVNEVGVLPSLPVLGALPEGSGGSSWALLWLLSGVLAGMGCAITILRQRPRARFDETALVGGLAGAISGLAVVMLGVLASGDIGTGRLTGVGVRTTALLAQAPALMGLSGVVTGAVWGVLRRPSRPQGEDEPTRNVNHARSAASPWSRRSGDGTSSGVDSSSRPDRLSE